MGLFNKLKNVLFEEEEVEETVEDVHETSKPEIKIEPLEESTVSEYKPLPEVKQETPKVRKPLLVEEEPNNFSERELFRSDSTFKFPAFDEEEFNTSMPHLKEEEKSNNVLDFERRNKQEKRAEYSRFDRDKSPEKPREEPKRFKPSPVISPVYGILDKDYKKEDIVSAPKQDSNILTSKDLDVETVRAKAFGKLNSITASKEKTAAKDKVVTETYNVPKEEKKEVIKEEELKIDDVIITSEPIIEEDPVKLREERSKTIDELLKDAADDVVEVTDDLSEAVDEISDIDIETPNYEELQSEIDEALDSAIDEIPEDISSDEEIVEEKKDEKSALESDTLESDLYDLIDSMYDNTEDGE